MSKAYENALSHVPTQQEQARPDQVKNSAGGYVFKVSDKTRLERFLILGTTGGTYYATEQDLTKRNMQEIIDIIGRDEVLVWETVKEVSESGRAYRNSPAIFVLALLFRHGKLKDGPQTVEPHSAKALLPYVCRTSTHLFEFVKYARLLGGSNRSWRRAVAEWYTSKTPEQLSYQAIKYRQREGWTHRDVFRLVRPVGIYPGVGNFILGKDDSSEYELELIAGFKKAQSASSITELVSVLNNYHNLPWEAIPTQFHKEPVLWRTLFENGSLTGQALVRNITRIARLGMFNDMVFARAYASALADGEVVKKSRLHPIHFLLASVVHNEGQLYREKDAYFRSPYRKKDWATSSVILDGLHGGFDLAFANTEPSNKRMMFSLDVSGSMSSAAAGLDFTCKQFGAAMLTSLVRLEPYYLANCFSSGNASRSFSYTYNPQGGLGPLNLHPRMSFDAVMRATNVPWDNQRTDCALPMLEATSKKLEVDTFIIFTDNETWHGNIHPYQALKNYRQKSGIDAKLIVAAVTSTGFSIADPSDGGMLDVVGGDANLPKLVTDFSAGRF